MSKSWDQSANEADQQPELSSEQLQEEAEVYAEAQAATQVAETRVGAEVDTGTEVQPPKDAANVNVIRSSMTIAVGTMTSRVLGFLRSALIIAALGAVGVQDSFQVAKNLPNLVYALLAGSVITAVLVPEIVRSFAKPDGGRDYVNRLVTLAFTLVGALTIIGTVFANVIVYLTAPYLSPDVGRLAVVWAYWFMPQIFFYGMQAVLGQVLNAKGHFWEAAWSPVLNNIVSIAGLLFYVALYGWAPQGYNDPSTFTTGQMLTIAIPTTLGIAVQGLSLLWPLHRINFRWKFTWGFRGYGLSRPFKIAAWTFGSAITVVASSLVVQILASAAESYGYTNDVITAGPAARSNATFIYMLPHSVITASVATAFLPKIAAFASSGQGLRVRAALNRYIHEITKITLFFSICLAVFAVPILQTYAASRSPQEIAAYASVLQSFAPILVFMALFIVEVDVLIAHNQARLAFRGYVVKAIALLVMIGLIAAFTSAQHWVTLSSAAEAMSYLFGGILMYFQVDRLLPGHTDENTVKALLGTLIAAVPAALVGALFLYSVGQYSTGHSMHVLAVSFAKCAVGGTLVLLVYLVGLWLVGDRDTFTQLRKFAVRFVPALRR